MNHAQPRTEVEGQEVGRRWWHWRRRRQQRYRLKDAHSEEDVSLYSLDPRPALQKVTTSDDTLLNPQRINVHYDDSDGDDEESVVADSVEAEAVWASMVWRGDEDDPDTALADSESDACTESEGEDMPKDGCNAVQTIVERLRACSIRPGRAADHDVHRESNVQRESNTWTSQDLRQFLLNKARLEHGGPYDHIEQDDRSESYEMTTAKNRRNGADKTSGVETQWRLAKKRNASSQHQHRSHPGTPPIQRASRPMSRGISASSIIRAQWRPRLSCPRSSIQLEHMGRDMSPPPPRQRLWSLPSIIVTTSEDPQSPSPPHRRNPLVDSMNYLTVPGHRTSRVRSVDADTRRGRGSESLSAGTSIEMEAQPHTVGAGLASATKLGSILDLWSGQWEMHDDRRSVKDERHIPRWSPPPDPRPQASPEYLHYESSFQEMYGRYSANLAEYARQEARRLREDDHHKDEVLFSKELQPYRGRVARTCISLIRPIWDHTFARLGEDWVFLFILGTVMATISFLIDDIILICFGGRMYLHTYLSHYHWGLQLFSWVIIPTLLVIFAAAFCQWMAPSAAGSGIPEMKTILRGVVLKEYLTWKTLLVKIVGLAAVLGAGLPLGKEGPVMHMASIVATMLTKMLRYIKGTVENDARSTDLLAAACTMGVAVCYAAPIGGVLFSIEVTTVYFAVRNYWRGFFAAVVGAMFYRLMSVWFMGAKTIYPLFKVELNYVYPYDVIELLPFLCIGIFCGFAGSLFVYLHRRYVMFMRQNKMLKNFLQKKRLLYPTFVTIIISIMTFPMCLGQFMASTLPASKQILHLFSNVTWSVTSPENILSSEQEKILFHWMPDLQAGSFHLSLFVFQIVTVIQIAISSTLPVPSGMLIPLFKVGAAFGRQIGEIMASLYPKGILFGMPIVPGAYAMVGAASFCAAITHTISISVIVFELTGQITYVIPIMIGVLISNCISSLLQPSIYDSMIRIKKLPYLPDIIATGTADVYNIYVEDIMVRDVKYIWYGITYIELKRVLKENRKLKYLPLVDKPDSMILLGSIQRIELVRLLVEQISSDKRRKEATRRHLEALRQRWEEEDAAGGPKQSRIRYEDEINDDDEEEQPTTPSLMHRFSRSLSRSFSRSSDSDDSSTSPPGSPASTRSKHDSDSVSPPGSPAVSRLKDLFPTKSPLARKGSRFSVSKVEGTTSGEGGAEEKDKSKQEGTDTTDETQEKPSKKRSTFDLLLGTGSKLRSASYRKKDSEKDPIKELRRRATLKRSNSLDSTGFRIIASDDVPDSKSKALQGSPKKGILKRRNSFSLGMATTPVTSPPETPYQTITAGDTKDGEECEHDVGTQTDRDEEESELCLRKISDARLRSAFEKVRMRMESASSMEFKLSQLSLFRSRKKDPQMKKPILDLTEEERSIWELSELSMEVDFTRCHIDPAPFQLVERTSLLRVHSMFSMLGINHAYVTAIGRLIGVVALKEVRMAIDGQYVGQTSKPSPQPSSPNTPTSPLRSTMVAGPSPQRLSTFNPISYSDPEAGTLSHRGSRTHLVNFSNGTTHS